MSNLKKICRICTFGLLHTKETRQKFYEIFEECDLLKEIEGLPNPMPYLIIKQFFNSNFQIGIDDGLPSVICPNCIERFIEMYELFKTCEKSQKILKKKFIVKLDDAEETFTDVPFIELPNIDIKDDILFDEMNGSDDSDIDIDEIDFNETEDSVMDVESREEFALNLLPEKSRKKYQAAYDKFVEWQKLKNVDEISEKILLEYFEKVSHQYKSSSLWSIYSMLKSVISTNKNIDIGTYSEVQAFLKRKSENYLPRKSLTFNPEEISDFIEKAPDEIYLVTKVAFIMGIIGACRLNELRKMKFKDLKDLGSAFLVNVRDTKSKIDRQFTITDNLYEICKKYIQLRPPMVCTPYFFLNYQNGKCTQQVIGINKFGTMGKKIAAFLKLENSQLYTGHSFKKTAANIFVNSQGHITALKRRSLKDK